MSPSRCWTPPTTAMFDLRSELDPVRPVTVGLGTDVGAGTSFSILAALGAAHQVAALCGWSLDPLHGVYLAILGGARALGLADRIGSLVPDREPDLVVLHPRATASPTRCADRAESPTDLLFGLATLGDQRAVRATCVAGRKIA